MIGVGHLHILKFDEGVKVAGSSSILVMTPTTFDWLLTLMPGRVALLVEPPLLADLLAQHLSNQSFEVFQGLPAVDGGRNHIDVVLYTGHLPAGVRVPVAMRLPGTTGFSPVTIRRRRLRGETVTLDDLDDLIVLIEREIQHAPA